MYTANRFVNSVVPRDQLEKEVAKYAHACSITRPNDVVVAQKTFIEAYKQYRGEYFGSLLTGWLEGMLPLMKDDGANDVNLGKDSTFQQGIGKVVKGMEVVDAIGKVKTGTKNGMNDVPVQTVSITKAYRKEAAAAPKK